MNFLTFWNVQMHFLFSSLKILLFYLLILNSSKIFTMPQLKHKKVDLLPTKMSLFRYTSYNAASSVAEYRVVLFDWKRVTKIQLTFQLTKFRQYTFLLGQQRLISKKQLRILVAMELFYKLLEIIISLQFCLLQNL